MKEHIIEHHIVSLLLVSTIIFVVFQTVPYTQLMLLTNRERLKSAIGILFNKNN